MAATTKRKVKKQQIAVMDTLATWVTALSSHGGRSAWCDLSRKSLSDDLPPHGLLGKLVETDPDALRPAVSAALGETPSGGRLAWQVSLPEAFHHDENAKTAVMFPDWDVRRGRVHLNYSESQVRLEMFSGRSRVVAGEIESNLFLDDDQQEPEGGWITNCEYTDDDVHYLEIEQPWTGGMTVQRQCLLIRDDRCVLLADSVLPDSQLSSDDLSRKIRYQVRVPLDHEIKVQPEVETRELFLGNRKQQALVIPLAAGEWRIGPSPSTLKVSEDQHLLLTVEGRGCVYAPLWFDFQKRRFRRKRTWRQLTVADQLRIVDSHEAVGYRVQTGSEQWLLYRSFGATKCRSVLGKHLIADFFAARFDTGDGQIEELITVDDNQNDDEH